MRSILNDKLIYEVLSVVAEIPQGRVATYGQIARLIGRERNARLVGRVLAMSHWYGSYPCHRVVNGCGRLVPSWPEQKALLEAEGVAFRRNGNVDMRRYAWNPDGAASMTF